MLRFGKPNKTCRVFRTAFQILLISCFFLASHPDPSGAAEDDATVRDTSLVSPKHLIDTFSTSTHRGGDESQRREAFLPTGTLHRFPSERASLLTGNQSHAFRQRSFLTPVGIRAPPTKAFS